jgi:hypothetical protein
MWMSGKILTFQIEQKTNYQCFGDHQKTYAHKFGFINDLSGTQTRAKKKETKKVILNIRWPILFPLSEQ